MKSKTSLGLTELFNLITAQGLTPNQFYLLYNIRQSISPVHVNIHQELRAVIAKGFLKDFTDATGIRYELQPEAITLIDQVEKFFKIHKKSTSTQLMGDDYQKNVQQYLQLFPKMKLPSGKAARSDAKNVETAFRWFMDNYQYNWDTILKATAMYVDDYERRNYMYMQTSQYFIRKQNSDKTWASELANMCAIIEAGDTLEDNNYFSEKVV